MLPIILQFPPEASSREHVLLLIIPFSFCIFISSETLIPSERRIAPFESERATTLNPASASIRAMCPPTFPNPCTAHVKSPVRRETSLAFFRYSRSTTNPPNAVAISRPREPPSSTGLPVRTAGTLYPFIFEYSSIIQAMICPSVFTSGAGTSRSGPIASKTPRTNPRLNCSSSPFVRSFGFTLTAPFAPPKGIPIREVFHVMREASACTSSRLES